MIRLFLAAFLAFATFGGPVAAQTADQPDPKRPTLKAEATITGDIVRIGDLIEHAGIVAKVPIFRAPDLGFTGTVSADTVIEAVRKHALVGIDTAGLREVVVTRASRTIDAKEIEDVVARALSSQFDLGPSKDIAVKFVRELHAVHVDPSVKGGARVARINFDVRSGRFDAALEFPADAGNRNIVQVSGRAIATMEIATVARAVERGGVLKDADVLIERRPRTEAGRDIVTRRDQVIGLAARNSLQPGRPLRASDLVKPNLVQRNETVTLTYEVPGIVLTVRGKAIDGGAEGDVISVRNEQSKRTVQGVIAGPGRVVVTTGSPRLAANLADRSRSDAR
jgi:flagella basal body P-ring formation protein FlgA